MLAPFCTSKGFADALNEIDLQNPLTEQLFRTLYGTDEVEDELKSDDDLTTDSEPIIYIQNPPIIEESLYKDPKISILYPEYNQPLTAEEKAQVVPIFDEFGEAAKDEYIRGALQNQRGYGSSALNHYIAAVGKDPENIWLKNRAAKACLVQSDFVRAEQFSLEVIAADPDNHTAMNILANIAYYRDQLPDAKKWFNKILETKPGNLDALESLARISYINERDYEATKRYCARIMQETNRNLNALLWNAEANAITGDISHAGDLYKQLIDYRPSLINRLVDMSNRLYREGRKEESEKLLKQGVEMLPNSQLVVEEWEKIVTELHGAEKVLTSYEDLIAQSPLDLKLHETFAIYLGKTKNLERLESLRHAMLAVNQHHIPSLLALAQLALEKDDFPKAVEFFNHAISAGPEDPSVFRDIGLVYLEYGKKDKAKELLREAALLNPEDPNTLVALGVLAEEEGNLEKAEASYKLALDASPADEKVLRLLGDFYRRQDDPYKASQIFEQLTAVDPSNINNQIRLAVLYMELNDSEALNRFQEIAPLSVNEKYNLFVEYGIMAMDHGLFERSAWAFEKALQISPSVLQIRSLMAKNQLHLGNPEAAESFLVQAKNYLKDDPEQEVNYQVTMVEYYLASHQYQKAEPIAKQLIESETAELYHYTLHLDSLLSQPNKESEIRDALNSIIRKFAAEQGDEVKRVRAEVYKHQKDFKRAISILEPMLKEDPESIGLRLDLADLYGSNDDIKSAEKLYRELIIEFEKAEMNRPLSTALNNFAYLYSEHSINLDEAYAMARRADSLNPRQDYILDTIGWIAFKQRNFEKAEEYLLKSYHFSLNDPEITSHLAILYEEMNQPEKALEYYSKAAAIEPTNPEWAKKMNELNKTLGQLIKKE
ncbi:MAG: tetratricopeptide repeat protein [Sumerlaeia bacterium]